MHLEQGLEQRATNGCNCAAIVATPCSPSQGLYCADIIPTPPTSSKTCIDDHVFYFVFSAKTQLLDLIIALYTP